MTRRRVASSSRSRAPAAVQISSANLPRRSPNSRRAAESSEIPPSRGVVYSSSTWLPFGRVFCARARQRVAFHLPRQRHPDSAGDEPGGEHHQHWVCLGHASDDVRASGHAGHDGQGDPEGHHDDALPVVYVHMRTNCPHRGAPSIPTARPLRTTIITPTYTTERACNCAARRPVGAWFSCDWHLGRCC